MEYRSRLLDACRRLTGKGFLHGTADSFSVRIPGTEEMLLVCGLVGWERVASSDIKVFPFSVRDKCAGLHAMIYQARTDVGAVTVSSPQGVRLLARSGDRLPPLFDEQVRHIGWLAGHCNGNESNPQDLVETLEHGINGVLLGEQLLCLGMTCERALSNTELYEKCALAYVIAKASGQPSGTIPSWVRWIANRRLLKDERRASISYRHGQAPESMSGY